MLVIPFELDGKDFWGKSGKIHICKEMTLEQAKEVKESFPDLKIIEEVVKKKTFKK